MAPNTEPVFRMHASGWRRSCGSSPWQRWIGACTLIASARSSCSGGWSSNMRKWLMPALLISTLTPPRQAAASVADPPAVCGAREVGRQDADAIAVAARAARPHGRAPRRRGPRAARHAPRSSSSAAMAPPMPPPPPVTSARMAAAFMRFSSAAASALARFGGASRRAEHVAVEPVDALRAADHGRAVGRIREALEDGREIVDVLLVELAVAAQVA